MNELQNRLDPPVDTPRRREAAVPTLDPGVAVSAAKPSIRPAPRHPDPVPQTRVDRPRFRTAEAAMAELGLSGHRSLPAWKRTIDMVGAGLLLLALSPFLALIGAAIAIDSKGGVFYGQERVGRGGRPFRCWKFRSMHRDADKQWHELQKQNEAKGNLFKIKNDPRCTRVGRFIRKTSLDELPQLWNVVRGEMSLVGPRPPLAEEVARYAEDHFRRLQGIPGITGLWQVVARDRHDFEEMLALDVEYLSHLSLRNDIAILLRTIPVVLFGRGSY